MCVANTRDSFHAGFRTTIHRKTPSQRARSLHRLRSSTRKVVQSPREWSPRGPSLQARSTTMKLKHLITFAVFCLLIALPLHGQDSPRPQKSNYRLSGPYTHQNLTVFLIHGKDQTTRTFLTLQEALAQKKVKVYETKDVNELAIRNLSNQDIYVQSGDIVRGGDQDRMISVDFI